jgi:hypothetical protein
VLRRGGYESELVGRYEYACFKPSVFTEIAAGFRIAGSRRDRGDPEGYCAHPGSLPIILELIITDEIDVVKKGLAPQGI